MDKKYIAIIAVMILVVAGVATYALTNNGSSNTNGDTVTITQNDGTTVTVATPVTSVCVVNTNAAEFLSILGLSDKVVGVSSTMKTQATEAWWAERTDIGSYNTPNAETILGTGATVVIGQCTSMAITNADALTAMGVTVILLDCYGYETQVSDLKQLASLFKDSNATAIANSYESFFDNIVDTLKSATSTLTADEKKTFISTMGTKASSKYYTGNAELSKMLGEICGLENAIAKIDSSATSSSASISEGSIVEYYANNGINLFILRNSTAYDQAESEINTFLSEHNVIKNSNMFNNMDVIKTVDSKVLSGPRCFVGMIYFITLMYPDLNIDGLTVESAISDYNSTFGTSWTSEELFYVYN
ncbi:MAG: ABC transporter substrate-binding protein [Candidatus Methanomethylophilaceae archaeon]|nr:ABC transporter substrate-binding protein [Candidatus Methanomethylophilaceae archaeon]